MENKNINPKYKELTQEIINAFESCEDWKSGISGLMSDMPINANGKHYSGINILLLWISANNKGFNNPQWMTYKQAKAKGAQVKKGEKGTRIIFYKKWEKKNTEGEKEYIPVLKVYTVFNVEQIEGLEIIKQETVLNDWNAIEAGEHLYKSSECKIMTASVIPCYIPSEDKIKIPAQNQFNNGENYYTTLAHEMVHSTMHKSRCDRKAEKDKRGYAFEELVAELGAVFTCAQLGIKGDTENHASYIKGWLKAMRNDAKYIFKAATLASKASDYLLNNINEKEVMQ